MLVEAGPLGCLWYGMLDGCNIIVPLTCFGTCSLAAKPAANSFFVNGLIFFGSMFLFNNFVIPVLRFILDSSALWTSLGFLYGNGNTTNNETNIFIDELSISSIYHLLDSAHSMFDNSLASSSSPTPVEPATQASISALALIFYVFWVLPLYLVSKVVNTLLYQEVADAVNTIYGNSAASNTSRKLKKKSVVGFAGQVAANAADLLFSSIVQYIMLGQISVMAALIPKFGKLIAFVYACWLTSMYAFEYIWLSNGISVKKRLDRVERCWIYFLGFGAPLTLVTFFLPFFYSSAIYCMLYPVILVMAGSAQPRFCKQSNTFLALVPDRVRFTNQATWLANKIIGLHRKNRATQD